MGEPADYLYRALMGANEIEQDRARTAIAKAAEERNAAYMDTERRLREYALAQQKAKEAEQEKVLGLIRTKKEHPFIARPGMAEDAMREAIARGSFDPMSAAFALGDITPGMAADAYRVGNKLALGAPDLQAGELTREQLQLNKEQFAAQQAQHYVDTYPDSRLAFLKMTPEDKLSFIEHPMQFAFTARGRSLLQAHSEAEAVNAAANMLSSKASWAQSQFAQSKYQDESKKWGLDALSRARTDLTNKVNAYSNLMRADVDPNDPMALQLKADIRASGLLVEQMVAGITGLSYTSPDFPEKKPGAFSQFWSSLWSPSTPEAEAAASGLSPDIKDMIDQRLGIAPSPSPSPSPAPTAAPAPQARVLTTPPGGGPPPFAPAAAHAEGTPTLDNPNIKRIAPPDMPYFEWKAKVIAKGHQLGLDQPHPYTEEGQEWVRNYNKNFSKMGAWLASQGVNSFDPNDPSSVQNYYLMMKGK